MRRTILALLIGGLALGCFSISAFQSQSAVAAKPASRTPVWGTATAQAALTATAGAPSSEQAAGIARLYDDLVNLVITRYPNGALAFYRLEDGNGRFHSWVDYEAWTQAAPGQYILDRVDDTKYHLVFLRLSPEQITSAHLWPLEAGEGKWYKVVLATPDGNMVVQAYLKLRP